MPAVRTKPLNLESFRFSSEKKSRSTRLQFPAGIDAKNASAFEESKLQDFSLLYEMEYPRTAAARLSYRTPSGKRVPPHHWEVYDLILKLPAGKISTYKAICTALGSGSPRSVGTALRNNPFAPYVPCHRVVASNFFVGGFFGEWTDLKGGASKGKRVGPEVGAVGWNEQFRGKGQGAVQREKVRMLVQEGVPFTAEGRLVRGEEYLWGGPDAVVSN